MNRWMLRIVAIGLIPALLTDSTVAANLKVQLPTQCALVAEASFSQQAFTPRLVASFHRIGDLVASYVNQAAKQEVFAEGPLTERLTFTHEGFDPRQQMEDEAPLSGGGNEAMSVFAALDGPTMTETDVQELDRFLIHEARGADRQFW